MCCSLLGGVSTPHELTRIVPAPAKVTMAEEEASAGRARWTSDAEAVLAMRRRAERRIFAG